MQEYFSVHAYSCRLAGERLPTRLLGAFLALLGLLSLRITTFFIVVVVGTFSLLVTFTVLALVASSATWKSSDHVTSEVGVFEVEIVTTVEVVEVRGVLEVVEVAIIRAHEERVAIGCVHCRGVALGALDLRYRTLLCLRLRVQGSEQEALLARREVGIRTLLALL